MCRYAEFEDISITVIFIGYFLHMYMTNDTNTDKTAVSYIACGKVT